MELYSSKTAEVSRRTGSIQGKTGTYENSALIAVLSINIGDADEWRSYHGAPSVTKQIQVLVHHDFTVAPGSARLGLAADI